MACLTGWAMRLRISGCCSTTDKGGFQLVAQFDVDADGQRKPHVNQGALFGFGRQKKELANNAFAVISLLAAVAIVVWSSFAATARDGWLCGALGLILGGTLGNFYDRVVFHGVRDFLHWNYLFDWPVFNIADCCLVCGAGLLLIQAFLGQSRPSQTTSSNTPANLSEPTGMPYYLGKEDSPIGRAS